MRILSNIELDAILGGLRLLQYRLEQDNMPAEIEAIVTNEWTHQPINEDALEELCQRLNTTTVDTYRDT